MYWESWYAFLFCTSMKLTCGQSTDRCSLKQCYANGSWNVFTNPSIVKASKSCNLLFTSMHILVKYRKRNLQHRGYSWKSIAIITYNLCYIWKKNWACVGEVGRAVFVLFRWLANGNKGLSKWQPKEDPSHRGSLPFLYHLNVGGKAKLSKWDRL